MEIELSHLDGNSESETLELKESFDSKALETIGAFANNSGGTTLVRVRDDGHVIGITLGTTTLEDCKTWKVLEECFYRYLDH